MLQPLTNPIYARLFSAQVIALVGTGLTTVALALQAYALAGADAGQVLGTALAIKMVAYVILAPIAGGLAPAVPRRAFLIALDLARAAIVVCLLFVTEVWQIYLLIFLLQACSAGFTPVFQATIPDILKEEKEYTKALSLSRLAYDLESVVSPVIAAIALTFVSFNALFAANSVAFLISAILVFSITLPVSAISIRHSGAFSQITFGLRAYLRTPRLRGLLAMSMAVAAAGAMVIVNTVVVVRTTLGLGEPETALLLAVFGGGSMAAALIMPRVLEHRDDRTVMLAGGWTMVAALFSGTTLPGFEAMAILWFLLGFGYSATLLPAGRLLRRSSSDGNLTSYFAAQFALSHACFLITYPLAGWLSVAFGLAAAFAVLGTVVLCSTLTACLIWPTDDPSELDHSHPEFDHTHVHIHDEHHQHGHEGWEGPEPHAHPHSHKPLRHRHAFVIDEHHPDWPSQARTL
ncbi:MAG: MFS transporter [Pseudomonadota bacterium]